MTRKTHFILFFLMSLMLGILCGQASALEILEPGYYVETYASYYYPAESENAGVPREVTFGPYGNMYLSMWQDYPNIGSIYRVTPDGVVTEWLDGLGTPRRIVWAGGTEYGDYLYVADGTPDAILRVTLDGTYSTFVSVSDGPHCLALDRKGDYGGFLYTVTRGFDHTYRIAPDGHVSRFSYFPGDVPNGPVDLAFDPGYKYGGLLYMALNSRQSPHRSGVFSLEANGSANRFAPSIVTASNVEVDPTGLFNGDMFIAGRNDFDQEYQSIYRAKTNGSVSEFAVETIARPSAFTFGPDGAMYVPEYSFEQQTVFIIRIIPYEPLNVAVDIKPGGCPNPLNLASRGILPVAVLGTKDFDPLEIDLASIRLEGIAPIRSNLEDAATPVTDVNQCACNDAGPDGWVDLTLKFKTSDIAEMLIENIENITAGDSIELTLTGTLTEDTEIKGRDCIVIKGKVPDTLRAKKSDINEDGIVNLLDFAKFSQNWLQPAAP